MKIKHLPIIQQPLIGIISSQGYLWSMNIVFHIGSSYVRVARLLAATLAACVLAGCSTSRKIPYSFEATTAAIKAKLAKNNKLLQSVKPKVQETPDHFQVSFDSFIDYYYSVWSEVAVTRLKDDPNACEISAKVKEQLNGWGYQSRSNKLENELLDCVEQRMKTGKWEKLPWRRKGFEYGFFKSLFQ